MDVRALKPKHESKHEHEPEPEHKHEPEHEPEPKHEPKPKPEHEPEPEPKHEPEHEPEPNYSLYSLHRTSDGRGWNMYDKKTEIVLARRHRLRVMTVTFVELLTVVRG